MLLSTPSPGSLSPPRSGVACFLSTHPGTSSPLLTGKIIPSQVPLFRSCSGFPLSSAHGAHRVGSEPGGGRHVTPARPRRASSQGAPIRGPSFFFRRLLALVPCSGRARKSSRGGTRVGKSPHVRRPVESSCVSSVTSTLTVVGCEEFHVALAEG